MDDLCFIWISSDECDFGYNELISMCLILLHNKNENIMIKNMGSTDKYIRLILAAVIAVLYFSNVLTGTLAIVALLFALILVATSFLNFCPLYLPFGISTARKKD